MTRRTRLAALALSPLLGLALVPPAAAAGTFPDRVPLPAASLPEGIAGGPGTAFFAGSRRDGSIVRGDLRTGTSRLLVAGQPRAVAVGMQYDRRTGLLWVAGGLTSTVTAYDGRTGELVVRYDVRAAAAPRFLNDVEVTREGVFVTDSRNAELVVVPFGARRTLPEEVTLRALTGEWVQAPTGNSANGIRALPGGDLLVVNRGGLYRVDPETGAAVRLRQTGGEPLTAGDGLELRGNTLYVVYGYGRNSVAVARLALGARSFAVIGELTKDEPDDADLERPTTATFAAGALWVVNGKFSSPDASEQEVVRLPVR